MISIDTEKLSKALGKLDGIQNGVKKAYDCDWNDPVHDSFGNYLDDAKRHESEVREEIEKIIQVIKALSALEGGDAIANDVIRIKNKINSI